MISPAFELRAYWYIDLPDNYCVSQKFCNILDVRASLRAVYHVIEAVQAVGNTFAVVGR